MDCKVGVKPVNATILLFVINSISQMMHTTAKIPKT